MMQDTGIQTPVGIKVKGKDLAMVQEIAQDVERLLRDFPGTQSVFAERISQGYFVDAQLDLERMAEQGVTVDEALPTVRFAIGGDNVVGIRQADQTIVPLADPDTRRSTSTRSTRCATRPSSPVTGARCRSARSPRLACAKRRR